MASLRASAGARIPSYATREKSLRLLRTCSRYRKSGLIIRYSIHSFARHRLPLADIFCCSTKQNLKRTFYASQLIYLTFRLIVRGWRNPPESWSVSEISITWDPLGP